MGWIGLIIAITLAGSAIKVGSGIGIFFSIVVGVLAFPPLWKRVKAKGINSRSFARRTGALVATVAGLVAYGQAYSQTPEGKAAAIKRAAQEKVRAKEAEARAIAETAEKIAQIASGQHCFVEWDDSLPGMKDAVKASLRNPKSFEHIATIRSAVGKDGRFGVIMRYRAQNGFGGMNVEAVGIEVEAKNCKPREVALNTLERRYGTWMPVKTKG